MTLSLPRLRSIALLAMLTLIYALAPLWTESAAAAPSAQSVVAPPPKFHAIPLPPLDGYEIVTDWDGKTLVVGAPWTDVEGHGSAGIVYIYSLDQDLLDNDAPNPWSLDAEIVLPEEHMESGGLLGTAVAVEGDLIVAGAPGVTHNATSYSNHGVALFIERSEDNPNWHIAWVERQEERTANGIQISMGQDSYFGSAIDILDGKVLIGAPGADLIWGDDVTPTQRYDNQGGAWLFARTPDGDLRPWDVTYSFVQYPPGSSPYAYRAKGASVAMARAEDPGVTYYVIGAPGTDNLHPADYPGSVEVWSQVDLSPEHYAFSTISRPLEFTHSGRFGEKIAVDGHSLAIFDRGYTSSAGNRMLVVNQLDDHRQEIASPQDDDFNRFGAGFALNNGRLLIGDSDTGYFDFYSWGRVHHFAWGDGEEGDAWTAGEIWEPDGVTGGGFDTQGNALPGVIGGEFGAAVASKGNWDVVIAPYAGETGMIYVFDRRPVPATPEPTPLPWLIPENKEPYESGTAAVDANANPSVALGADMEKVFAPIIHHESDNKLPPTATPSPTTVAPTTVPPTATPSATPTASPTAPAPTPTPSPTPGSGRTQLLVPGGTMRSLLGGGITVAPGATDESRVGYALAVSQPITPLLSHMQPLGEFYAMGVVTETLYAAVDAHFIVRLPVPEGVDTSQLGALLHLPDASNSLHGFDGWSFVPGYFNAPTREFYFTLTLLPRGGVTVVLVTGESLQTLGQEVALAAESSQGAAVQFDVRCIGMPANDPVCTETNKQLMKQYFTQGFNRYEGLGFLLPSLQLASPPVDIEGNSLPMDGRHFAATFITKGPCAYAGHYNPTTRTIDICLVDTLGPNRVETINHELFHAVQFAYPNIFGDWKAKGNIKFLIEGTGSTASRSTSTELLQDLDWPLRETDSALNVRNSTDELLPYQTQDFWVYTGRKLGATLGYLHNIFNLGAEAEDVDVALGNNLAGAYWEWIKNHLMEKQINPDYRYTAVPCILEPSLSNTSTIYAVEGQMVKQRQAVNPLSTRTYRIRVDNDLDYAPLEIDVLRGGPETRYKIYKVDGSQDCLTESDTNSQYILDARAGDVYIVIVSNANVKEIEFHELVVSAIIPS